MRPRYITLLAIASLALPAFAQQGNERARDGAGRPGRPRAAQRGPGPGGPRIEMMAQRLAQSLELSQDQIAKLDEIVAKHEGRFQQGRERSEQMRTLMQEYRTARESGDESRLEELRAQIRESSGGDNEDMMAPFFDDVSAILTDEQAAQFAQWRERMQGRGGERGARMAERMERQFDEMADALKLDGEQQARFDELMDKALGQYDQQRTAAEDGRSIVEQMREARREGDADRILELEDQMRAARSQREAPLQNFFDELEKILNDSQKQTLERYRARMDRAGRGGEAQRVDVQTLLRVVKRMELTAEQTERIREIEREAKLAMQDARGRDAQTALVESVKRELKSVLDADQFAELERSLGRGGRGERGDRQRNRQDGQGRERPARRQRGDDL
ncbi:MAG: hypothetical protein KKB50_03615 [Planctomycetes bacterium]|nr:hypothetical protein [Planctomycetota bacterium]